MYFTGALKLVALEWTLASVQSVRAFIKDEMCDCSKTYPSNVTGTSKRALISLTAVSNENGWSVFVVQGDEKKRDKQRNEGILIAKLVTI